jgi:hypothetical protein
MSFSVEHTPRQGHSVGSAFFFVIDFPEFRKLLKLPLILSSSGDA